MYKEQERELVRLEALSKGETPPVNYVPELAYENVEPSGKFGVYFNADLAGLKFLETLDKGLSSKGVVLSFEGRLLEERGDDFKLSNFLMFSMIRGSEDSAPAEKLSFFV